MASNDNWREIIWNNCIDWRTTFAKLNRLFNLAISEVPECNVWGLIAHNKHVGICGQPTTACCNFFRAFITEMEWSEWFVAFIYFIFFRIWCIYNILTIPHINLIIRLDRQQLIQKWMILKLPNRLVNVIFPNSYAVIITTCLRIFFFKFQIRDFPYSNDTFYSSWK